MPIEEISNVTQIIKRLSFDFQITKWGLALLLLVNMILIIFYVEFLNDGKLLSLCTLFVTRNSVVFMSTVNTLFIILMADVVCH